jgi:phosphoribosylformylglycinamidine cyclo-ligase
MSFSTYDLAKTEKIIKMIQGTWPTSGPFLVEKFKNQIVIKKDPTFWKDYLEIDRTDGIGTKGSLHWKQKTFSFAAQDAFAMNANDIIRAGAEPYRLQDHITIEEENDDAIFSIVKSLVDLCKKYKIAITSGETAILNTIKGLEIGITMTGRVKKDEIINPEIQVGDKLIGLASNGIHSNGITIARKILGEIEELTKPTEIYLELKEVLKNHRKDVHGMAHITGGAFTKLKDIMNDKTDIKINRNHKLEPKSIFNSLKEKGNLSDETMYKTFNNGIGFIIAVDKNAAESALDIIKKYYKADIIGSVEKGSGKIKIESKFSDKIIQL